MKKSVIILLSALMLLISAPTVLAEKAENNKKPAVIYIAEGFENQPTGVRANGFGDFHQLDTNGIEVTFHETHEVEKLEMDGNADNQAMILKAENNTSEINFIPAYYVPISNDFVMDFKFKLGSEKASGVIGSRNNLKLQLRGLYCDGHDSTSKLVTVGSTITVGETEVKTGIDTNWHRLTLKFNMKRCAVDVYVDGELAKENVKVDNVSNYCEFTFASPDILGEYWAIDDVNIYISDEILDDEEFGKQVADYKNSGMAPIDRYQTGFLYQYRNYMYETLYDEFVMCKYGRRLYKDNKFHSMPHNVFEEDGDYFVALRAFCEAMGAEVGYVDGTITVNHKGNSLVISKNSTIYNVNGKEKKLPDPIEIRDWHTIVNLDVLTDFFGLEYQDVGNDIISFSGEVESDYSFQQDFSTYRVLGVKTGFTLTEEVKRRIRELLTYDIPSTEEVRETFEKNNPDENKMHILGLWYDFDDVREMWKNGNGSDPVFNTMMNGVIGVADTYLKTQSLVPAGKSFAEHGGGASNRSLYLSFAYKVTGEQKYLDGINRDIDILYDSLEPWNEDVIRKLNHKTLTIATAATGLGTAYDWIKNDLDADRRAKLKAVCMNILEWFDARFADPVRTDASAFTYSAGNQPIIIMNGIIAPAMATFYENPEFSTTLLAASIDSVKQSFDGFAPAGEWEEGVSYWQYCMDTMPHTLMNIEVAMGDTCGLYEAPGVSETCGYPLSVQGTTGEAYPFGDGDKSNPYNAYFMYEGHKNGDMGTVNMRKENQGKISVIDILAWVPDDGSEVSVIRDTDQHLKDSGTAIMRTGWTKSDTSVILHGGSTGDGHGHLDNGDVQFDMLGYRWATAVGRECYYLYQFGDYNLKEGSLYTGYAAFDYYRDKGEGHNTVIANLGATRYDMERSAKSEFEKVEFSDTESFAIIDMTPTNKVYKDASRGVKLDKISGEITIQDEFTAKMPTEFWWFMNTQAEIELSEDKKSAILSTDKGKKKILVSIISDGDEIFQDLPSAPLPGYPTATEEWFMRKDSGYPEDAMLRPPKESPLDGTFKGAGFAPGNFGMPFRKLAIQKKDSTTFNVTVVAKPITGTEEELVINSKVKPLKDWKVNKAEKPAKLDGVTIDGVALEEFNPNNFYYTVVTVTEKDPIPTIECTADEKYDIEIIKAESSPGVTSIIIRENGEMKGAYYFTFRPLNDTTLFVNERQIPIVAFTCNSQPEENNPATNLFDGNMTTSYTTDAAGGGVTLDFGKTVEVAEVMMSFRNGASRTENFTIEASVDGENFEMLFDGMNSGTTADWESFTFGRIVNARYIRVLFYGNNSGSSWCNITGMAALTK